MQTQFTTFIILALLFVTGAVQASLIQKIKNFFSPSILRGLSENTTDTVNIIIVKRDVAETIERRSAKGQSIEKQINQPNSTNKICSDDQLMVYLAEIQAINPETIINLSTMEEVFIMCRQVGDSLDKMNSFLQTCRIVDDKDMYLQLIKGVDKLYDLLCEKDSKFKEDFQNHFPCIKQLHDDFETCFGPPDWVEDANKNDLCKAYKDIAECYYIKTSKVCGEKAAKIMKTLVTAIVNAIIPVHCSYINWGAKSISKSPTGPTRKSKTTTINANKYIIIFTLYILKRLLL